jgi:hypothetical protein
MADTIVHRHDQRRKSVPLLADDQDARGLAGGSQFSAMTRFQGTRYTAGGIAS